jgi:hypothetical protein
MKQYSCIVKVGTEQFLKYHTVRDLVEFTGFLDTKFPTWRYYNVFDKETKAQITSFTKSNRPQQAQV